MFPTVDGHCIEITLILLVLLKVRSGNTQTIIVYGDHYQQGDNLEVNISKCSNFPDNLASKVTSINTQGKCARFYDGINCSGHSIQVMSRSPSHHNLHGWDFNDKAVSVGPCLDSCSSEVIGKIPETPLGITIFDRVEFRGAYANLQVHGCTLVPLKFTQRLLSVKIKGECIQFYNNVHCQTTGDNIDSIELRTGTPSHEDIRKWGLPEAIAVSHCSYKCNKTFFNDDTKLYSTELNNAGDVVLFTHKNFEGNWKKFNVQSCTNLINEWEGVAVSLKTFNNECVTLYDRRNCTGDSLNVETRNDLGERKFDAQARSMKPCSSSLSQSPASPTSSSQLSTGLAGISSTVLAVIIVVPICGVLLSVFLVLFLMRKCNPYKHVMDMLSDKEIQEFLTGFGMDINSGDNSVGDDYSVELLAQNRPYNDAYEIPRSNIKYDQKALLGMGEFGSVYKGSALLPSQNESQGERFTEVAIKTVRPSATSMCLRSLLKEVKVMLYVGKHLRIVEMLGCCTENLQSKGEILVLMEFCPRGSLESFLAKNRNAYQNMVKKGRIDESAILQNADASGRFQYENLDEGLGEQFNFFQLLQWCLEIAEGMVFLSEKKIIHSDLACRNILLDGKFQSKISDFGLSKQLYCYTEYVKKRQEPLPWRWLAIESLKNLEFSSMSDVWGYGILCWEVFTLAEKPYQGLVWGDDFIRNLEDGLRLPKPKYTISECYNLLLRCWDESPKDRPSFSEIFSELDDLLSSMRTPQSRIQSNIMYTDISELQDSAV